MSVLLDTTQGEIVIDLFTEKCYRSSLNFLKLCKLKRYNFHPFYSVLKDYSTVVKAEFQTDESIWGITQGKARNLFKPEIKFSHDKKGYVSFITEKVGELKLACSSFFIALDQNSRLDEQGAVFGIVVEGFDVLDRINNALCDQDNRPFVDIRIKHTIILEDPFEDIPDMDKFIPDSSPLPSKEMLKTVRLSSTNELLNEEQRNEQEKIQEMEARQLTLEMIGDLPFADVKPPENVLFICKLNPITRDSDLRMIFGRFGPLLGCEIVKDKQTGESLGYGFIEYENKDDCEMAYAKMNNVLIDDRRIHVDFSQSVTKLNQDFANAKKKEFGNGLRMKTKYREHVEEDSYKMVFEHEMKDFNSNQKESKHRKGSERSGGRRANVGEREDRERNEQHRESYDRHDYHHRRSYSRDRPRSRSPAEDRYRRYPVESNRRRH